MNRLICSLAALVFLAALLSPADGTSPFRGALRLRDGKVVGIDTVLADLKGVDMVFIGENHDDMSHHQAQRDIIAALHESGRDLAIGMEMFRADGQPALTAAGFVPTVQSVDASGSAGVVVYQFPAAGTQSPNGSSVLVVVGKAADIKPQLAKFGTWKERKISEPGF